MAEEDEVGMMRDNGPQESFVSNFDDDDDDDDDDNFARPALKRQGGGAKGTSGQITVVDEYKAPSQRDKLKFYKMNHPWNHEEDRSYGMSEIQFGMPFFICTKCRYGKTASNKMFGTGVVSYFKVLKSWTRFLLFLFVFTLPAQYINFVAGPDFNFASLTVGNLYQEETIDNEFFEFDLGEDICGAVPCKITKTVLLQVYILYDCVVVIFFLSMIEYTKRFLRRAELKEVKNFPSINQYTVEVKNLPDNISYEQLRDHFETRFGEEDDKNITYDVQLVTKTKKELEAAIKHGKLGKKFKRRKANFQFAQKLKATNKISDKKYGQVENRLRTARDELENFWTGKKIENLEKETEVMKAYVTFNNRTDMLRCLKEYDRSWKCSNLKKKCCCQKNQDNMIEDKMPRVQKAPSPATIKWENQEYSLLNRFSRSLIGYIFTALIILASAAILTALENTANVILNDIQAPDCSTVNQTLGEAAYCNNNTAAQICTDFKICNCLSLSQGFDVFTQNPECSEFFALGFFGETGATAAVVTIFNIILQYFIIFSVRFERKLDLRSEESAKLIRFFIAAFVNAACIVLLKEMDIKEITGLTIPLLDQGNFIDFSSTWYNAVGTEIVLIAFGNIWGIHAFHYLEYAVAKVRRRLKEPLSQVELNELFLGHTFFLSLRYAQFMLTIFLCMVYSTGMPIMYIFAFFTLFVSYYADKYLLIHFYRTPPRYNNATGLQAVKALRWAAALHIIMSIWTFTSPEVFPESVEDAQSTFLNNFADDVTGQIANGTFFVTDLDKPYTRFLNPRVIPLLIVLFSIPFYGFVNQFIYKVLAKIFGTCCKCCICKCCGDNDKDLRSELANGAQDEEQIEFDAAKNSLSFEEVIDSGHLYGLESYNIISNPLYWNTFQLKDGVFTDELLGHEGGVHSTKDVMEYLEKGEDVRKIRVYHNV